MNTLTRGYVEHLAAELRAERARAKMSADQVGEKSGLGRQSIWRYETGRRTPDLEQLAAICGALGLSVSELILRVEAAIATETGKPPPKVVKRSARTVRPRESKPQPPTDD